MGRFGEKVGEGGRERGEWGVLVGGESVGGRGRGSGGWKRHSCDERGGRFR